MNQKIKQYKFYKYYNNPNGSDYCFYQRPVDSNMSLRCFWENGEICGFMSESLVYRHKEIKEIDMNEFMHDFVKPLIKENQQLKEQQKEFIEWLTKESKEIIRDAGYHQRICEDILEKYKEIIGSDK